MANEITAKLVRKHFHYDPETGVLSWKEPTSDAVKVGQIADSPRADGYYQVSFMKRKFMVHRLVWLYMTWRLPRGILDHVDGVRTNNRWKNLREVTNQENSQNVRKSHADNQTGYLGVSRYRHLKKRPYRAEIRVNGKPMRLGIFETAEEAHLIYLWAKTIFHPSAVLQ